MPVLLLFGLALYLPLLDARPLRFEEGRRAVQALEILAGESWWHLQVLGEPYINKPPLLPWLIVLASYLRGGLDEVAVRLPAVLAVLLGAVSAGGMARLLAPERSALAGLAAGIAFLSCAFVFTKARLGETDTLVTAFCGVAFLIWAWARLRGRLSWPAWAGVWFFLAAAAFTKGPIPVVFPALAIVLVPLLLKLWREALVAGLVVAASMLPLAYWAYINLAAEESGHWTSEMRVSGRELPANYWLKLLHLNQVPVGVAYTLPWVLPAMLLFKAEWRQLLKSSWPVLALALYAIPWSLFVLIWGEARPRYAMPAAWAIAALAGGWMALRWVEGRLPALLLVLGAIFVSAYQLVMLSVVEGRTDWQLAYRAKVEALADTVRALPEGPVFLFWAKGEPDHDALAYAGRPLQLVQYGEAFCPDQGHYMLADTAAAETLAESGDWTRAADIGGDWMHLYVRDEADCPRGR